MSAARHADEAGEVGVAGPSRCDEPSEPTGPVGPLGLPRPADILPHRDPFLFLSELVDLVPGQSARGFWRLSGAEAFFPGHFPGRPTLPGVLMLEALAQLGATAVLADERFAGMLPLFGGIERARFRRQVLPGDRLDLEVRLGRLSARAGTGHGVASVSGERACEADLLFVFARA